MFSKQLTQGIPPWPPQVQTEILFVFECMVGMQSEMQGGRHKEALSIVSVKGDSGLFIESFPIYLRMNVQA